MYLQSDDNTSNRRAMHSRLKRCPNRGTADPILSEMRVQYRVGPQFIRNLNTLIRCGKRQTKIKTTQILF